MTTQNIEDLSAQISLKIFTRILWLFGLLILAGAGAYYGLKQDISDVKNTQSVRAAATDGKFEVINSNLENLKNNLNDVKSDVKDIKLDKAKR